MKPAFKNCVILSTSRDGYAPDQCRTITVGEMIEILEGYDPDTLIFTGHDYRDGYHWYTYGGIDQWDFIPVCSGDDGEVIDE